MQSEKHYLTAQISAADRLPFTINKLEDAINPSKFSDSLISPLTYCATVRQLLILLGDANNDILDEPLVNKLTAIYSSQGLDDLWKFLLQSCNDIYLLMIRARTKVEYGTKIGWMGSVIQPELLMRLTTEYAQSLTR